MSGMNQATHDYIVFKLAEALKLLVRAKYDTPVQGFKNIDLAIDIVHGCQKTFGDTWGATRDVNRAMPDLVSARKKLLLVNAGDAAPDVAAAIKHVDEIIKALEHHIDVSASKGAISASAKRAAGKQRKPRKAPTKRMSASKGAISASVKRAAGKQRKPRKAPTKRMSASKGAISASVKRAAGKQRKPRKAPTKRKRTRGKQP
jgi:hypothetical protein